MAVLYRFATRPEFSGRFGVVTATQARDAGINTDFSDYVAACLKKLSTPDMANSM